MAIFAGRRGAGRWPSCFPRRAPKRRKAHPPSPVRRASHEDAAPPLSKKRPRPAAPGRPLKPCPLHPSSKRRRAPGGRPPPKAAPARAAARRPFRRPPRSARLVSPAEPFPEGPFLPLFVLHLALCRQSALPGHGLPAPAFAAAANRQALVQWYLYQKGFSLPACPLFPASPFRSPFAFLLLQTPLAHNLIHDYARRHRGIERVDVSKHGNRDEKSHVSRTSRVIPSPSLPITSPTPPVKSVS